MHGSSCAARLGDAAHTAAAAPLVAPAVSPHPLLTQGPRSLQHPPHSDARQQRRGCCSNVSSDAASSGLADPSSSRGSVSEQGGTQHSTKGSFHKLC